MKAQCVHFVGFRDLQQWANAVQVWGEPDIVHHMWDQRAQREVATEDVLVFAKYDPDKPSPFNYDDSNQSDDPAYMERIRVKKKRFIRGAEKRRWKFPTFG